MLSSFAQNLLICVAASEPQVRLDGAVVTHFLPLEAALDVAVGGSVTVEMERGGAPVTARLAVQDLHAVTPAALLQVAGSILHALSYQQVCPVGIVAATEMAMSPHVPKQPQNVPKKPQNVPNLPKKQQRPAAQARNGQLTTGQVYVADTGYWLVRAGVPKHAVIVGLGGRPTPDLASFAAALAGLEPGTKAPIQYTTFEQRQRTCSGLVHVDWTWCDLARVQRTGEGQYSIVHP